MTTQRREKESLDWRSDWWLWPSALLLVLGGWGQAFWMWENSLPAGFAPITLLFWVGLGVAGLTLAIYWFARRWWLAALLAMAAWLAVPAATELAREYDRAAQTEAGWLQDVSPLLVLALLGIGLSGVMMGLSWYARNRWAVQEPNVRALREALWSGLFVVICGLLLISRAFTFASAALLAGSLVLMEAFLIVRESVPGQDEQSEG
jgi:hypothetical protein